MAVLKDTLIDLKLAKRLAETRLRKFTNEIIKLQETHPDDDLLLPIKGFLIQNAKEEIERLDVSITKIQKELGE